MADRQHLGAAGERAAADFLRRHGYALLARNYRCPGGEVDVIALERGAVVFVEVKARADLERALEAVTPEKRRRLNRAVRVWLSAHPQAAVLTLRGDAVFCAPWRWPRHHPAAFELDLG